MFRLRLRRLILRSVRTCHLVPCPAPERVQVFARPVLHRSVPAVAVDRTAIHGLVAVQLQTIRQELAHRSA